MQNFAFWFKGYQSDWKRISSRVFFWECSVFWTVEFSGFFLTLLWRRSLLSRNQSIDLPSKSVDWFLYDRALRHKRVNDLNKHCYYVHSVTHKNKNKAFRIRKCKIKCRWKYACWFLCKTRWKCVEVTFAKWCRRLKQVSP